MTKAFLLAAGRGLRFRPVTERIPKALLPFLNIPLLDTHVERLERQGIRQVGLNLHHLSQEVLRHLEKRTADSIELVAFREHQILGTAGALRNAATWLSTGDILVVNCDTAIEPEIPRLLKSHRRGGRLATLLVVENREPHRYTPLQAERDRIVRFGKEVPRPLAYTGVCVLSSRLLERIPPGEASLVADLWEPMLARGDEIGWALHEGAFADLGRPGDFLRASLEALTRGGPFPESAGLFDPVHRVLSRTAAEAFEARLSVLGRVVIGARARIDASVVWDRAVIGEDVVLDRCLVAGGRVASGSRYHNLLLWPGPDGQAKPHSLDGLGHCFQPGSPRR